MGNYSHLYATRNGASQCRIHWDQCRPLHTYQLVGLQKIGLEMTLEELGHTLDDTKLIGYLEPDYISDLREICRHMSVTGEPCTPRLYFDYEGWSELYYLEFHPGTDVVLMGIYPNQHAGFPEPPEDDASETAEELYTKHYDQALEDLHQRAMEDVKGWKIDPLIEEDEDAPGSAITIMCMIQGISPHDSQAVKTYLQSLPPEKARKLMNMRASELIQQPK